MNYQLTEILAYTIALPALLGLIRIRSIDRSFLPFLFLIWIGLLNEILNTVLINGGHSNAVNSNIYVLLESLIILWFFDRQGLFYSNKKLLLLFLLLYLGFWTIENFYLSRINRFSSYFRVFYSLVIVLMSIHLINQTVQRIRNGMLKNAVFLICIGFIVFFTYKSLVEIFWIYGLNASDYFRIAVYNIMTFINLAVNIFFLIAIIWMPRKQESILL